jgi:predicted HTH domain antitoxin
MTRITISQADLAKKTQEIVDRVQHGELAVVESAGHEQAVVLDPLDFRLLQALAQCAIADSERESDPDAEALHAYLADEISLGKAADLLGLSRFELQERFLRLGVPLRLGPATLEEARAEVNAALKFDTLLARMVDRGYRCPVRSLLEISLA